MTDARELEEEVQSFRHAKDEFMRDDPHSPLPHQERHHFGGLHYFPYNAALRLEVALDPEVASDPVTVETSTGDSREYSRVGKFRFDVEGHQAELTVFSAGDGEFFLPLRDATSGPESYGAGRYLEPEKQGDNAVLVDFNYLYNPYCAYNEMYSCPLPPRENWLQVPIRAGEKKFHDS
ncbi:MAG: DUF1684 domain-containing protein [Chloroflexota bacterium]